MHIIVTIVLDYMSNVHVLYLPTHMFTCTCTCMYMYSIELKKELHCKIVHVLYIIIHIILNVQYKAILTIFCTCCFSVGLFLPLLAVCLRFLYSSDSVAMCSY